MSWQDYRKEWKSVSVGDIFPKGQNHLVDAEEKIFSNGAEDSIKLLIQHLDVEQKRFTILSFIGSNPIYTSNLVNPACRSERFVGPRREHCLLSVHQCPSHYHNLTYSITFHGTIVFDVPAKTRKSRK